MSGDEFERDGAAEPLPVSEAAMEAMLRAEFLEPREPAALPAGFKERVLARAAAESPAATATATATATDQPKSRGRLIAFPRGPVWRMVVGGALAASVLGGTFGVELERRQHDKAQRAAGQAEQQAAQQQRVVANEQFQEASRITDEALEHTRRQLERAGVFEDAGR